LEDNFFLINNILSIRSSDVVDWKQKLQYSDREDIGAQHFYFRPKFSHDRSFSVRNFVFLKESYRRAKI